MKFIEWQRTDQEWRYSFFCPGCQYGHWIQINPAMKPCWEFNGDCEKPTVSPSIRTVGQYHCHLFIKDGMIQFLDDCDHALKGQTVPIPDFD